MDNRDIARGPLVPMAYLVGMQGTAGTKDKEFCLLAIRSY